MDDMGRSPFYPGRRTARPDASCFGRRAVEDALAIEMYRIIVGVGGLPIDLYGAHAHGASEIDIDFMPALSER